MNTATQKRIFLWGGIAVLILALIIVGLLLMRRGGESDSGTQGGLFNFLFNTGGEGIGAFDSLFRDDDTDDSGDASSSPDASQPIELLSQVFSQPVSGATFVTITRPIDDLTDEEEVAGTEEVLAVRVVATSTGNIFDIPVDTLEAIRITNTTIPSIYDSLWNADGSRFFTRSLNDTDTVVGTGISISTAEEEGSTIGTAQATFLRTETLALDVNPIQDSLFLLERTQSGSRGIITSFSGEDTEEVFSSPLSEWLVDWAEDATIYLTTKPSAGIPGYAYSMQPFSDSLNLVLGGINGLTTLVNADGTKVLFSESSGTSLTLKLLSGGEETVLLFDTLPEKCTWNTEGSALYCGVPFSLPFVQYPDTWYKGEFFFEDGIWYFDAENAIGYFLVDPSIYDTTIDLINPVLSEDESLLLFTNKRDMTPWIFRVETAMETVNY